ncbi:hypothetical protein VMCG_03889 [Cytospora schulzeri]|uniref:Uncharacterized protein n=1 Tax=Cytospora schulzeri TaxID=448051 RepID=A0A423WV68_9PEZI|nr:hypothetical protein VMCG_03889 [Valsa malicola]
MSISKKTVLITGCSDRGIGAICYGQDIPTEKGYYLLSTLRNASKAGTLGELDDSEILGLRGHLRGVRPAAARSAWQVVKQRLAQLCHVRCWMWTSTRPSEFFDAFAPLLVKARGVIINYSYIAWDSLQIRSSMRRSVRLLSWSR